MNQQHLLTILIQIIIPLVLTYLFAYSYVNFQIKTTHFVCPFCRSSFKLSKLNFAFARKTGVINERIVTCPVCGYKGRMPILRD